MRIFIFALLVTVHSQLSLAYSFLSIGAGPAEQRTSYWQFASVVQNPRPQNDITMIGQRWQLTIGGSGKKCEWYGQFRMYDSQWGKASFVTQTEDGYQTLTIKRWQWDRAFVCGYRRYISQSRTVTTLLGGGALLGVGRGHQSEHQTTTVIHEDRSRETTDNYFYNYRLKGLKAGLFADIGSRFRISNYLFLEALFELGASAMGIPRVFFATSTRDDDVQSLGSVIEPSFMLNLRWDFGRALER